MKKLSKAQYAAVLRIHEHRENSLCVEPSSRHGGIDHRTARVLEQEGLISYKRYGGVNGFTRVYLTPAGLALAYELGGTPKRTCDYPDCTDYIVIADTPEHICGYHRNVIRVSAALIS